MNGTLWVRLRRAEGALLRMLGVVGRRGFETENLVARPSKDGRWIEVTMSVKGTRPVELLERQIMRLVDVEGVEPIEGRQRWTAS